MAKKYTDNTESAKLDQFYTNPYIAKILFEKVENKVSKNKRIVFLEPSAGSGSFSDLFRDGFCFCFDLDPKESYIIKKDFFTVSKYDLGNFPSDEICTIGNPPFGKNSSLAVKFFNHASILSDTICFIVPKTFKKQSIHNRLNLNFKLIYQEDLPKNSFIFDDDIYDVPCVFQIWIKTKRKRRIIKSPNECELFKFSTKNKANLAIRRAGGQAGKAFLEIDDLSESSNYFVLTKQDAKKVAKIINEINFKSIVSSTAGVRSLSKGELIREIEKNVKK